jgi:hypothetical protein
MVVRLSQQPCGPGPDLSCTMPSYMVIYVVTYFWVPIKKKYKKIYIKKYSEEIQKIIGARKGCWNAEKRSKLVKELQKYKN